MREKQAKKGKFFQGVRGKIFLMGGMAMIAAIILGVSGIVSLNSNNNNNEVLAQMNRINLYQYENQINQWQQERQNQVVHQERDVGWKGSIIGTVFWVGLLLFFGWIWVKNKSPGR